MILVYFGEMMIFTVYRDFLLVFDYIGIRTVDPSFSPPPSPVTCAARFLGPPAAAPLADARLNLTSHLTLGVGS